MFSPILNLRIFSRNLIFHFCRGVQAVFFRYDKQLYRHFDINRKLQPCRKTNQRKFREKNLRFVDSGLVKTCDELDLRL